MAARDKSRIIQFTVDDREQLRQAARASGLSVSGYVRRAVRLVMESELRDGIIVLAARSAQGADETV